MKQEIVCPTCKDMLRKLFPTDSPYPNEHVKFVEGEALRGFICDQCAASIGEGDHCFAFTIWADHGRIPYHPWEHDFIKPKDEKKGGD